MIISFQILACLKNVHKNLNNKVVPSSFFLCLYAGYVFFCMGVSLVSDSERSGLRLSVRVFFFKTRECLPEGDSGESACRSRPRPHRDSGAARAAPPKTRPNCRAHGARDARHELVGAPRQRDSRGGRQVDDAFREVATSFFFGFCVNVCGWRLSDQVELL